MKKIFSWGMMLAAAFTLTNCAKEIDAPVQEPESVGYPFEIIASTADTKTVNDGMSTNWVAEDQINLFHAVCDGEVYKNNGAFTVKDVESGNFAGNLCEELDPQEEYDWYAFYPYKSQIASPKNEAGWAYIGNRNGITQAGGYGKTAHLASSNCPLYGVAKAVPAADTPSIEMQHLSSVVAINVINMTDEPLTVTSATLTANEPIVGSFYIDFSSTPTYTASEEQYVSNAATVNVTGGTALENGDSGVLYLVVKPFTAAKDSKLYLSVNGYEKELTMPQNVTFTAGKIKTLNFKYDKADDPALEGTIKATISFANKDQRTSFSTATQVWENENVTLTNNKGNGSIADYSAPVRFYKNTEIVIEAPGNIVEIEFNSASGEYFTNLKNLLPNASVSGTIVTQMYDASSNTVSYTLSTGQIRLNSITVTYSTEAYVPPVLESIDVSGDYKTEFTQGSSFSFGGVVTATYDNGATKDVTDDCEFSGYSMDQLGDQTVTVTYEDKTTEYGITVIEKTLVEGYTLVTDLSDLTTGQYVIAAKVGDKYYAMSNTFDSKISGTEVTVTDNTIAKSDAENFVVTITKNGDKYSISSGTDYLKYSSSTNLGTQTSAYSWTIAKGTAGTFRINATTGSNRAIMYQTSGARFGGYSTTNTSGYADIELFKLQ